MAWSEAFAVQAASDYDAYRLLSHSTLPSSHRLHYLQMWLEKLCKAYLWRPAIDAEGLKTKHNVIAKILPSLLKEHWRRIGFDKPPDIREIRKICREIDLHPRVLPCCCCGFCLSPRLRVSVVIFGFWLCLCYAANPLDTFID